MATDIMDSCLKAERNQRWEKADSTDRRATICVEHFIQASDVSHWRIYRKWTERFFEEMYQVYLDGRAAKDPTVSHGSSATALEEER